KIAIVCSAVLYTWLSAAAHAHNHSAHHSEAANSGFPATSTTTSPVGLRIQNCWVRAMPAGLPSAAYFRMENHGAEPLTLHGVHSRQFKRTLLHTSQGKSGGMQALEQAVLPVGGVLEFAPGGHHVMLEQPLQALEAGQTLPLSFWFGGSLLATTDCAVKPAGTLQ